MDGDVKSGKLVGKPTDEQCECGGVMYRYFTPIRCPEVWLKCAACGEVVDMEPEEYFGPKPMPTWARPGG
jgi:hypothetical protein